MEKVDQSAAEFLRRHAAGDWGELDEHDRALNEAAVASGEDRLMSAYRLVNYERLWIITEWDQSATTLLLPEEY